MESALLLTGLATTGPTGILYATPEIAAIASAAPSMATVATVGSVASTGVGVLSSINQGKQANAYADYQAKQLRQNAIAAEAQSQRKAMLDNRQTQLAESKALALAAASGGGASDPSVVNTIGDIAERGEYNSAMDLYNGKERARSMTDQANATLYEGEQKENAGYNKAIASVLKLPSIMGSYKSGPGWSKYGDVFDPTA